MKIWMAAAALALSGCGTMTSNVMNKAMSSWIGSDINEVIDRWGYPSEEKMIADRRLIVWSETRQASLPATTNTSGYASTYGGVTSFNARTSTYGGGVVQFGCERIFEVSPDNIVVSYQWQGNNCPFADFAEPYKSWTK